VTADGLPLGTLCVLDYVPRPGLTLEQGEVLLTLARQGSLLLEYRRALKNVASLTDCGQSNRAAGLDRRNSRGR